MRKRSEDGYALLLVFAMAAALSILLYMELPRLVFESQRIKEQDLIDRGEQYSRAIQLYVRKFKKYPASLDDLEKADNIRFLRRRYPDPMTGSDEWRLIHIDNAGMYTDSLVHKPPQADDEEEGSQNTFITEGAAFGSTGPAPGTEAARGGAAIKGASDRPVVTAEQFQGPSGGGMIPGQPGAAPQQGYPRQPGFPGQPGQGQQIVGAQPGQPGIAYPPQPGQPGQPGQYPYQQGVPGTPPRTPQQGQYPQPGYQPGVGQPQASPSMPFGVSPYMVPGQQQGSTSTNQQQQRPQYPFPQQGAPGVPGPFGRTPRAPQSPQPATPPANTGSMPFGAAPRPPSPAQQVQGVPGAAAPGQGGSAAMNLISKILTTPRPGGLQGLQGGGQMAQGIGGGIAGVATTLEAEGIMVYKERTKYNEWEFLYDLSEEQANQAGNAARGAGMGGNRNPLGGPGGQQGSGFGQQQGGFGQQQGGFGQRQGGGFGSQGQGSSFGGQGQGQGSPFGGQPPPAPRGRGR